MRNLSGKVDGTDNLPAGEWNELAVEENNIIVQTGQTPASADLNQLGKGMAEYTANGNFYVDSGVANAYVLSSIGLKQSAYRYVDGMEISCIITNTNTGASTVNVSGLGVKNIINVNSGGELQAGSRVDFVYRTSTDDFQYLRARGLVESIHPITAGTPAAYTVVLGVSAYVVNGVYSVSIHASNTGAATISFDGLPAVQITTLFGKPLSINQFRIGMVANLKYNGVDFISLNPFPEESRGALVSKLGTTVIPTLTETNIIFDAESYDTDSIHSNTVTPERLTVPAGVSRIKLSAGIFISFLNTGGDYYVWIKKTTGVASESVGLPGFLDPITSIGLVASAALQSAEIEVIPGDYFTLRLLQESGSNATVGNVSRTQTWFAMEIIR